MSIKPWREEHKKDLEIDCYDYPVQVTWADEEIEKLREHIKELEVAVYHRFNSVLSACTGTKQREE